MRNEHIDIDWSGLLGAATGAATHAYAPYSRFRVGAAVLTADGNVFTGCNVENASYGLTICAERAATFAAVSASEQKPQLVAVAIVTDPAVPASPCGACRQVLMEFGPDAIVSFLGVDDRVELSVRALLPMGFALDDI
jgi:cytidine deaminase